MLTVTVVYDQVDRIYLTIYLKYLFGSSKNMPLILEIFMHHS